MVRAHVALAAVLLVGVLGGCATETRERHSRQAPVEGPTDGLLVQVPDVVGMEGQQAVDAIEAEDLTASYEQDDPADCTVEDQDQTGEVEAGTEVVLTLDCRQRDWDNREGEDWENLEAGFAGAAEDGCAALFSRSPDGSLYGDDGQEYTVTDCSLAIDDDPESAGADVPADVPDDPEQLGRELGFDHGCEALFVTEAIGELHHGEEAFTADDCLAAGK